MAAMRVRSSSLLLACAVLLSASAPALAQGQSAGDKKKARQLFEKGKVQYDLGRWKPAIDLWMEAYETFDAPEFLFNIGQAYRHEGDCQRSLFFYRRYLATRPNATNRGEVEGWIKQLEGTCNEAAGGAGTPGPGGGTAGEGAAGGGATTSGGTAGTGRPGAGTPSGAGTGSRPGQGQLATRPGGAAGGSSAAGTAAAGGRAAEQGGDDQTEEDTGGGGGEGEVEGGVETGAERPHLFAARIAAGPSFPSIGNLEVGTLVSLTAGIGHPFYLGSVVLEPGAVVTYSPVPWEVQATRAKGTAGLTGLIGDLGISYPFLSRLSGRVDLGAGALILTGLGVMGNPFIEAGATASGPIGQFQARGALGVEFSVTNNFIIHAQPLVLSYSPSSKLRDGIDAITRFEVLVGAGYTM